MFQLRYIDLQALHFMRDDWINVFSEDAKWNVFVTVQGTRQLRENLEKTVHPKRAFSKLEKLATVL